MTWCSGRPSRPTSGGCSWRAASTSSGTSAARRPTRDDGRTRSVGRRVPRLGRERRLPGDRPGLDRRPGPAGAGAGAARVVEQVVPVRRAPDRGPVPDRANYRVRRPGSARRWSRSAPSRPGSPTRSTTRPPRRPARSTRWVTPATPCCPRSGGSPSGRSRPSSSSPSTRCGSEIRPAPVTPGPAGRRRSRGRPVELAGRPRRRAGLGASPRRWPTAGVDVAWCERAASVLGGSRARAGAGMGGEHAVGRDAAGAR